VADVLRGKQRLRQARQLSTHELWRATCACQCKSSGSLRQIVSCARVRVAVSDTPVTCTFLPVLSTCLGVRARGHMRARRCGFAFVRARPCVVVSGAEYHGESLLTSNLRATRRPRPTACGVRARTCSWPCALPSSHPATGINRLRPTCTRAATVCEGHRCLRRWARNCWRFVGCRDELCRRGRVSRCIACVSQSLLQRLQPRVSRSRWRDRPEKSFRPLATVTSHRIVHSLIDCTLSCSLAYLLALASRSTKRQRHATLKRAPPWQAAGCLRGRGARAEFNLVLPL
jgi:hypothetical protein